MKIAYSGDIGFKSGSIKKMTATVRKSSKPKTLKSKVASEAIASKPKISRPKAAPVSSWLKVYNVFGQYPRIWKTKLRLIQKAIAEWAGNRCEMCALPHTEVGTMHIHHLIWDNKHDCTFENLVCVCCRCHLKLHNRRFQPNLPVARLKDLGIITNWDEERWGEIPDWYKVRNLDRKLKMTKSKLSKAG